MVPKDNWKIDLNKTAVVTIDIVRTFLDRGAPMETPGSREFVPKLNELTGICRDLGIPIIHVAHSNRADLSDMGLLQEVRPRKTESELELLGDRKGPEFYEGLNVSKSDYIVNKIRYSAFIQGSSHIEQLLRGLGRDSIILSGVLTDVCSATTTQDAMMLGFKVFFVADLNTTMTLERQKVALEVLDKHFAKVMTFEAVMDELKTLATVSEAVVS